MSVAPGACRSWLSLAERRDHPHPAVIRVMLFGPIELRLWSARFDLAEATQIAAHRTWLMAWTVDNDATRMTAG
jgi:hypothetical protein